MQACRQENRNADTAESMPKIMPLLKGVGSFLVPSLRTTHKPLGSISAAHCYSVFLRNVALLKSIGATSLPKVVAELGPGSSFGTGFAALIAGAQKYYALDLIDLSYPNRNLEVFDELVSLFRRKQTIPASGPQSLIFPDLDSYDFPTFLSPVTDAAHFDERVGAIREDIVKQTGIFFEVSVPWTKSNIFDPHSIDWLFRILFLNTSMILAELTAQLASG